MEKFNLLQRVQFCLAFLHRSSRLRGSNLEGRVFDGVLPD